jgi:hypothetical protein
VTFSVGSYQLSAVLDTGCEASILSTQLYNELRANGVEILELPTQNVVLVGAFSRKKHHVKKQVFMTLKFGNLYIEQVFLVSDQLLTPMLIGCDFCIANGLVLDFQREKLLIIQGGQSIEIDFMNRRKGAREREDSFGALRNQQVGSLPTPLVHLGELAKGKIPHPLRPPPCKMDHCDPKPNMLRVEGHENVFHCKCVPSNEADIASDSSSENCGIGDKIESCSESKSNYITCDDESHLIQGVEGGDDVYMLAVAAVDRVPGDSQERDHNKTKNAKARATNPSEEEVDQHLVLRDVNVDGNLPEHQVIDTLT